MRTKLIIWMGDKHSGKTTAAAKLAQTAREQEFKVAGVLAPSVYCDDVLVGFDICELRTNARAVLARRKNTDGKMSSFIFLSEGLELGRTALSINTPGSTDLVIVDEFGPVELNSDGWRKNVDLLIQSSEILILLVVRQQLVRQVQRLYENVPNLVLSAGGFESVNKVLSILKGRRQVRRIIE